jgi:RNA polymerase sigma-70 factor (ECF subfamily)
MLDLRTDEQLMVAARDGDDEAFRALAGRLRHVVARFLRHLGCEESCIEDLVQETLLRLWASRGTYEQRAALKTYVLTIAKNLWLYQRLRRRPGQRERTVRGSDEELDRLLLRDGRRSDGADVALLRKYRALRLRRAIVALPERQRLVFVLAHVEDLAYADIARMLGVAEGTVKSRMHRAVRNLRRSLQADFPGLASEEE